MNPPNTTPLNEELSKLFIDHKLHHKDIDACFHDHVAELHLITKLTNLIQTLEKKARIDELNKLSLYRETDDRIDVDFVDWQSIENRLSELGSAEELSPNNTTTRSKE